MTRLASPNSSNPSGRFTPETAAHFGRRGGARSTPAKRRASRRNGKQRRRVHALFSSRTVEWPTPRATVQQLAAEFGPFTLDPCATPENATAPVFFTRQQDGLVQPWAPHRVFMNAPYGATLGRWMRKAWEESQRGALVCLVPARTDTTWWHDYATKGEIRYLRGRLRFGTASSAAPFPSAIVVFQAQ